MILLLENALLTLPNGQETQKKIRLAAGFFLFLTTSRVTFDWNFVHQWIFVHHCLQCENGRLLKGQKFQR